MTQDYCPICLRPEGAGHEGKCLDTRGYDPDKASWEEPETPVLDTLERLGTCNTTQKVVPTPSR